VASGFWSGKRMMEAEQFIFTFDYPLYVLTHDNRNILWCKCHAVDVGKIVPMWSDVPAMDDFVIQSQPQFPLTPLAIDNIEELKRFLRGCLEKGVHSIGIDMVSCYQKTWRKLDIRVWLQILES